MSYSDLKNEEVSGFDEEFDEDENLSNFNKKSIRREREYTNINKANLSKKKAFKKDFRY